MDSIPQISEKNETMGLRSKAEEAAALYLIAVRQCGLSSDGEAVRARYRELLRLAGLTK